MQTVRSAPDLAHFAGFDPVAGISGAFASIAGADLDGDGLVDLVLSREAGGMETWLGHASGTYTWRSTSPGRGVVRVADFNRDRHPDLVHVEPTGVQISLGHGDGTFGAEHTVSLGRVIDFVVADVDHDDFPDVIASVYPAPMLRVFRNARDFTAGPTIDSAEGAGAIARLAVADFDRDGSVDVVTTGVDGTAVWLGAGNGSFALHASAHVACADAILARDLDNDGCVDVVTLCEGRRDPPLRPAAVQVQRGDCRGGLVFNPLLALGGQATSLDAADLDGDGYEDLVAVDSVTRAVQVVRSPGQPQK